MESFRIISTTADVGIQIEAKDEPEIFKHALLGLNVLLFESDDTDVPETEEASRFPIDIRGDSIENLLVKFLEEILFITYSNPVRIVELHVNKLSNHDLSGELIGIKPPCSPLVEIKSVTYHNLRIQRLDGTLSCRVIFDI